MKVKTYIDFLKGANWWEQGLFAILIWHIANLVLAIVWSYQELLAYDGPVEASYFLLPLANALPWLFMRILALRSLVGGTFPWLGGMYLLIWGQIFLVAFNFRSTAVIRGWGLEENAQAIAYLPEEIALILLPAIVAAVVIYQRWRSSQLEATS